ncbi:MAG TPA: glycoside hydrolase family 2 [Prolixibacteraceae bacterium]|nr:glycoside hydrolase family 2 [Prolixibacteraceae bacterium]
MNQTKFSTFFIILVFSLQIAVAQHKPFLENLYDYIENPQMIGLNQEEGHAPLLPYTNLDKAFTREKAQSSGYLSLDGKWKFLYTVNPDGINKNFFRNDFSEKGMAEITVPGMWQMQGWGEKIFRNVAQPFKSDPPKIPRDYNPVGSYRKTFNVPSGFWDKQLFLHFEGVASAYFVWINGQEVGYNQGANEPAEFDVTKLVKPGKNTVSVMVFQYSDGIYNEDQDMWRLGGIFRSVYLMATPKVHIRDYYVSTDLDDKYEDATLKVEAEIQNYSSAPVQNYQVQVCLFDQQNRMVLENLTSEKISLVAGEKTTIRLNAPVKSPLKWSDEKPNLYHIGFELIDPSGKTTEALSERIGFKEVEVKHQVYYVNGVPVKLNGVNSHMQHPDLGHTMDVETIRKDFYLMKQFNINCVRTCHYPPVKEYLELADELGIYIVDEAGVEAHATEFISNLPEWTKSYVERTEKMVLRDRNHPSIIFWSAGNESGSGFNICEVIAAGKRLDPSRPAWMYGGNDLDHPGKNPVKCEDIIGPRYGTPFELKVFFGQSPESVDPSPSFMDEYLAATGNSLGGLDEYWDVIYEYPRLMGGAIWDFVSPGLREKHISTPDASGKYMNAALMGKTELVAGKFGKAVQLTGTDTWVELYRDPKLDISGKALTVSFWVKPREWNGNGTFVSKGFFQFGIEQISEKDLEFYVGDKKKTSVITVLPENWQNNWHLVTGIYNGTHLQLYINGVKKTETPCSLTIENKPFPINIGRNPEIEAQENPDHYSNAAFDQFAVFDKAMNAQDLMNPTEATKKSALCWLDFDEQKTNQEFFSMGVGGRTYGTIWPDRTPQPEMWQIKKSAQPVSVKMINETTGEVEIWNRMHFTNTSELEATWQLQCEGAVIKEGTFETSVPPVSKVKYTVPYLPFVQEAGKEYFLMVSFRQKTDQPWAKKGFEKAWDQLPLKSKQVLTTEVVTSLPAPEVVENSDQIQVKGGNFAYHFSKKTGCLTSIVFGGTELLKEGLNLNVWRAPLANDIDQWTIWKSGLARTPGMGTGQSNAWFSHGLDQMATTADRINWTKTSDEISLVIESHTSNSDISTSFENQFVFTISGLGRMTLDHTVIPCGKMPEWLPRMGLQMVLNQPFDQIKWYGRGPFETYPDRKTGAKVGVYSGSVADQYVPYLIPQENGNKTDVRWTTLQNAQGIGVKISSSEPFSFSAQNVQSDNLSRALYPFQLKPFEGVTLNVDYTLSGVGCTAISVLNKYRVMPSERQFQLIFEPF